VLFGDAADRAHVGRLAEQVHRHDRARARCDGAPTGVRVDRQRTRVHVDEDRPRADRHDSHAGERCGQGRDEHLVARADVEGAQAERNRVGAAGDADGEARPAGRGEFGFEQLHLRPEDVPPAGQHAIDGRPNRRAVVGGMEVDERQPDERAHSAATPDVIDT
jgi:hypothetical protein